MALDLNKKVLGKGLGDITSLQDVARKKKAAGVKDTPKEEVKTNEELDGILELPDGLITEDSNETINKGPNGPYTKKTWATWGLEQRLEHGRDLVEHGDFDEAVEVLSTVAEDDPSGPDIWHLMGVAFIGLQRTAQAVSCFAYELANDPDSARAWKALYFLKFQVEDARPA